MAFVRNHTTGTSASGTAVTATLAADVAARNLLVVWVAMDNTGTTTPTVSSIGVPAGETATWARFGSHDSSSATSAAGVRGELWAIQTTQLWPSGTVITATLSASPPKSHMLCQEHSVILAAARGTAGTSTSTTGAVSAVTSGTALVSGDLIIGAATFETSTTPTGDADPTNGSWSTALTGNTGGGASAAQVSSVLQYKYVTATGVQTYNPTAGSTDSGAAVVSFQPDPNTYAAVGLATLTATANQASVPQQVLDLGASDITGLADGAAVTSWADESGLGNTVTQATAGLQPTWETAETPAGLPVVRLDGTDDRLAKGSAPVGTATQAFTWLAVLRPSVLAGAARTILNIGDSTGGRTWRLETDGKQGLLKTNTVNVLTGTATRTTGVWYVLAVRYTAAGVTTFWKTDGTTDGSGGTAQTFTDATNNNLVVGMNPDVAEFFGGDLAAVRAYNYDLTDTQVTDELAALRAEWFGAAAEPVAVAATAYDATATVDIPGEEGLAGAATLAAAAYGATARTRVLSDWTGTVQATTYAVGEGPASVGTASLAATVAEAAANVGAAAGAATPAVSAFDATATVVQPPPTAQPAELAAVAYDAATQTTTTGTGNADAAALTATAFEVAAVVATPVASIPLAAVAQDPTAAAGAAAQDATLAAAAQDAATAVAPTVATVTLAATAFDATVSTVATGSGTAQDISLTATAQDAAAAAAAAAATISLTATANDATASTAATATGNAEAVTLAAAAFDVTVAVAVPTGTVSVAATAQQATGQASRDAAADTVTLAATANAATATVLAAAEAILVAATADDAIAYIPPPVPPPRWVEGASVASGLVEGELVGAGIVEGSASL